MVDPTKHIDTIRAIAYKIAWNSDSFQEAIQEICVGCLEAEEDEANIGLVMTKARCRAIDYLRSGRFHYSWRNRIPHIHFFHLGELQGIIPQASSKGQEFIVPDALTYNESESDSIESLLASEMVESVVGDRDREMLTMWMDGYSDEEIATWLSLHRSSVSKRMSAVIIELRERYGVEGAGIYDRRGG